MQNYKYKYSNESDVEEKLFNYLKCSKQSAYCTSKLSNFSRDLNKIIGTFGNDEKFLRYLAEMHKNKCITDLNYSLLDKQAKDYMKCAIKRRSTGILLERNIKPV